MKNMQCLQKIEAECLPGMCQFGSCPAERRSWELCSGARLLQYRTGSPIWIACSVTGHYLMKIHISSFHPDPPPSELVYQLRWMGWFLSVRYFSVPGIYNSGHYGWIICQRGSSRPQQVAFPAKSKHWQKCLLSIDRCINELVEVCPHLA